MIQEYCPSSYMNEVFHYVRETLGHFTQMSLHGESTPDGDLPDYDGIPTCDIAFGFSRGIEEYVLLFRDVGVEQNITLFRRNSSSYSSMNTWALMSAISDPFPPPKVVAELLLHDAPSVGWQMSRNGRTSRRGVTI